MGDPSECPLLKGCGYRFEELDDPLMQKIRYLDKLVDELARGRKLTAILRGSEASNQDSGRSGTRQ